MKDEQMEEATEKMVKILDKSVDAWKLLLMFGAMFGNVEESKQDER